MRTLRKLLYVEVLAAVALVIFAFSALFLFFDLSDELNAIQSNKTLGYTVSKALIYVALMIPSHLYELMPIAVLIGTIFVMARLAQSSGPRAAPAQHIPNYDHTGERYRHERDEVEQAR